MNIEIPSDFNVLAKARLFSQKRIHSQINTTGWTKKKCDLKPAWKAWGCESCLTSRTGLLYCTVPYCTVLYSTVPYCNVLYHTVLSHITGLDQYTPLSEVNQATYAWSFRQKVSWVGGDIAIISSRGPGRPREFIFSWTW